MQRFIVVENLSFACVNIANEIICFFFFEMHHTNQTPLTITTAIATEIHTHSNENMRRGHKHSNNDDDYDGNGNDDDDYLPGI